jgi:hypothetical protein
MAKFVRCTDRTGVDVIVNLDAATYIRHQDHDTGMLSVIHFVGGGEISVHGEPHSILNLRSIDTMASKRGKG